MQKVSLVLLVSLLWLGTSGSAVFADGMLLPLPEALSPGYLGVRTHHVTVRIEDGHAVTRVEQEFYNPHGVVITGRYLFPVPPEASLSRFQATVDGQRQAVTRQDASATKVELYEVVAQQHDPSLLQYAGWESLAFDLTLPPGGSREMILEYEEVLAPSGGLYHYRYVLSTERYSSQPLDDVSVTVDLRSASGLTSLYSSEHEVTIERLGSGRARVSWEAQGVNPDQDFHLFFALAEGGFGGGLLTGERNDGDHFLLLFSPEAESRQLATLAKDIVFVIDRSGSMSGEKIGQARNALHFILGQLGEDDRFTIIGFDDRVSVLDYALQPVERGALQEARRYVDRLTADGSTDLESALQTALEILLGSENREATRMVVFLTDGLPTAGITDEALIGRLVTKTNAAVEARLHVFGVGYDVNTHLLDGLAAENGGTVTYVRPGENLELALTEFYGKIAHPLLTDLEVEFEGFEASDLYPEVLPDLFQGSSLMLTGRYRSKTAGDSVSVRVRGRAGAERREYVYHLNLEETGGHDFVPRLWATRRVGALLDRVRVEGASPALEDEIRELGLNYGIVTPYTAFVIDGQAEGAASGANMALYDLQEVNQASGRVTIEARVQNQMYQQAAQASLATGANVANYGKRSLAQVGVQQVDLALLQGRDDLEGPITSDWLERNVEADRTVEFGSDEYFALAEDPEIRLYLQGGPNVVFAYKGEVITVQDPDHQVSESDGPGSRPDSQTRIPDSARKGAQSTSLAAYAVAALLGLLMRLIPVLGVAMLVGVIGLFVLAAIVYYGFVR
jgi:Ca-activated chloride channel family protein